MENSVLGDSEGVELDEEIEYGDDPVPVDVQIKSGHLPKDFSLSEFRDIIDRLDFLTSSDFDAWINRQKEWDDES